MTRGAQPESSTAVPTLSSLWLRCPVPRRYCSSAGWVAAPARWQSKPADELKRSSNQGPVTAVTRIRSRVSGALSRCYADTGSPATATKPLQLCVFKMSCLGQFAPVFLTWLFDTIRSNTENASVGQSLTNFLAVSWKRRLQRHS